MNNEGTQRLARKERKKAKEKDECVFFSASSSWSILPQMLPHCRAVRMTPEKSPKKKKEKGNIRFIPL
jgi:hypothetical protein